MHGHIVLAIFNANMFVSMQLNYLTLTFDYFTVAFNYEINCKHVVWMSDLGQSQEQNRYNSAHESSTFAPAGVSRDNAAPYLYIGADIGRSGRTSSIRRGSVLLRRHRRLAVASRTA